MITILIFLIVLILVISSTIRTFAKLIHNGEWGRLAVSGIALAAPVVYYLIYGLN